MNFRLTEAARNLGANICGAIPRHAIRLQAALIITLCLARLASAQTANTPGLPSANLFQGSVPTGTATGAVVPLSLKDAVDRALKYNLGLLESQQATRSARAARLASLSGLLPNLTAHEQNAVQQLDLPSEGFVFSIPGVPKVVGPFAYADARVFLNQTVFDWSQIRHAQSGSAGQKAADYSYQNSRNLVVQIAADAYLVVISDAASVDSIRAQVDTASALEQRAADEHNAGVVASIDELRAPVELQTQQQRLIAAKNQLAIDKLLLARVIGLPNGQEFSLTDTVPYTELAAVSSLDQALQRAYASRPDYQALRTQVHTVELTRSAATAENYPSVLLDASFGDIGSAYAHSHETFALEGTLNIPIFQGTRVRADVLQTDAELKDRQAELANLGGQIDTDVRTAFLNLTSSSELVAAAKSNVDLAAQTLAQAQDRFAAGVADNLEVVQAQESVAAANQAYITGVYSYNVAKVALAQSIGVAEASTVSYLGVQ